MKKKFVFILLTLFALAAQAQYYPSYNSVSGSSWINTDYNTTEGTEFWLTFLRCGGGAINDTANITFYVYAAARKTARVRISNPRTGYSDIQTINGFGQVCFRVPNKEAYMENQNEVLDRGILVESLDKVPLSVYATCHHKNGMYDATNVLPKHALTGEYVVQNYLRDNDATEFALVATQNYQYITIDLLETKYDKNALDYMGLLVVDTIVKKQITVGPMYKGQSFMYRASSLMSTLSGTKICATGPVAVFCANQHTKVHGTTANHLFSQADVADRWGKRFVVTSTYGQNYDIVRFTALANNTVIKKNGVYLATINALDTYQDTIYTKIANNTTSSASYYTTSEPVECFLYATCANNNTSSKGAPVMTPIIPQESGARDLLFTTFTQTENEFYHLEHYVNVVTETSQIGNMRLVQNGTTTNISNQFTSIPNSPYSYAEIKLTASVAELKNVGNKPNSVFTARVYGMGKLQDGSTEAYAYSAGSRVTRSLDALIDDKYIKEKTICSSAPAVKFTSIINYEYDNIEWQFPGGGGTAISQAKRDSIVSHKFTTAGNYTVNLIVHRTSALCENPIADTVKLLIHVKDEFEKVVDVGTHGNYNICYGEQFKVSEGGVTHTYTAETTTAQYKGKPFVLNKEYVFTDSLKTVDGCDSIIRQHVIIRQPKEKKLTQRMCEGDYYQFGSQRISGLAPRPTPYTYTANLTTSYGCDSTVYLTLYVDPTINELKKDTICQSDVSSYRWEHDATIDFSTLKSRTNPYTYESKHQSVHKCDSTYRLSLLVLPEEHKSEKRIICEGDELQWRDTVLRTAGTYTKYVRSSGAHSCESSYTINLHVAKPFYKEESASICEGETYTWQGHTHVPVSKFKNLRPNQTYLIYDSLQTTVKWQGLTHHCDSVYLLRLTILPRTTREFSVQTCQSAGPYSYGVHGKKATETGTYRDTIYGGNRYGCDSILVYKIVFLETIVDRKYVAICSNALPYNYPDPRTTRLQNLLATNTYRDTLKTIQGCDSVIELHLTVNQVQASEQTVHVCSNRLPYKDPDTKQSFLEQTTYQKTIQTMAGCDSVVTVHLVVDSAYTRATSDRICDSDLPYNYHDQRARKLQNLWRSGTYTDTIPTVDGCDSIIHFTLAVLPVTTATFTVQTCRSAGPYTYGVHGKKATETGTYRDTIYGGNRYGCDSLLVYQITVLETIIDQQTEDRCDNELPFNHPDSRATRLQGLKATGVYRDTLVSITGCDSVIELHLNVWPTYEVKDSAFICDYETYTYEGHMFAHLSEGEYRLDTTLKTIHGCDSLVHFKLTVWPSYKITTEVVEVCQNRENPLWKWYDKEGTYHGEVSIAEAREVMLADTLKTIHGCDSIFGLQLLIHPIYRFDSIYSICDNERISWQGKWYAGNKATSKPGDIVLSAGEYGDTITYKAITTCDSTYILHLQVYPTYHVNDPISICENEQNWTYTWNQKDAFGSYNRKITFDPILAEDAAGTIKKDKYIELTDTIQTIHHCDSVVTLQLTIHPIYEFVQEIHVCQDTINTTWEWKDDQGGSHGTFDIRHHGTQIKGDTLKTIYGCDSVFGIKLVVDPIYRFDSTYNICDNERTSWQGRSYCGNKYQSSSERVLTPGTYYDTAYYKTVMGCDSIFYLQLHVYATYEDHVDIHVCENERFYVFETHDTQGHHSQDTCFFPSLTRMIDDTQKDTMMFHHDAYLQTIHGCDSLVHLHLTIHPSYLFVTRDSVCFSEIFEWRGRQFTETTVIADSFHTQTWGCDSVYALFLYVKPVELIPIWDTICDNETIYHTDTLWLNRYYYETFTRIVWKPGNPRPPQYSDVVFKGQDGCDSLIYRYYLTIYPTYKYRVDIDHMCSNESYYSDSLQHEWKGMNLEFDVDTFVQAFDTVLTDYYQTMMLCDSVFDLFTKIVPSYHHVDYDTICDDGSAQWREHIYQGNMIGDTLGSGLPAGDYVFFDSLQTMYGCDSVYELRLKVHKTYFEELHETICDNQFYDFHGLRLDSTSQPLFEERFYTDSLVSIYGCDSVFHLYLTIYPTTDTIIFDTLCAGDVYDFHGVPLTQPGFYRDTTLNEWGCEHYTDLHLAIEDPTTMHITFDDICIAYSDQNGRFTENGSIEVHFTYEGRAPISYCVTFDSLGHSQGFEDMHEVPFDEDSVIVIPLAFGEELPMPIYNPQFVQTSTDSYQLTTTPHHRYPRPGDYQVTVSLQNGICSEHFVHRDTTFVFHFPSWIHEQHWSDAIVLYNEKYNGGYRFDEYQWYRNGEPIPGEIQEYLYDPQRLHFGSEYRVRLHIVDEAPGTYHYTCPIIATYMPDQQVPTKFYMNVVPTMLPPGLDGVDIISNTSGRYQLKDALGRTLSAGKFTPYSESNPATHVSINTAIQTVYFIYLQSDSGDSRTIKIQRR